MAQDRELSRSIRKDYRQAQLMAKDRVMLEYTDKLVRDRLSVGPADHEALRRAGFSNSDIFDITLVVGNFMLANTLTDAFGLEYHENLHHVFVDETSLNESSDASEISVTTLLPGDEVWLNTSAPALLRQPLLVYTWDWTHPASVEGLDYLAGWQSRYAALGLTVLSVLAPEFPFAKNPDAARRAIERLQVTAPTALVRSYRTWRGANNTFWPAWHLFDADGNVVHRHSGAGGYAAIEHAIQEMLRKAGQTVPSGLLEPTDERHRAGATVFEPTPALYAVHEKGRLGQSEVAAAEGRVVDLVEPDAKIPGSLYVHGRWLVMPDGLELADGTGGLVVTFRGAGVTGVFGHHGVEASATILLDGGALGAAAGRDAPDGTLRIAEAGLYSVVDGVFGEHEVRIVSSSPGFRVHALMFQTTLATEPGPWPLRMVE